MRGVRGLGLWLAVGLGCGAAVIGVVFGVAGASARPPVKATAARAARRKKRAKPATTDGITLTTTQVIRALAKEGVGVYRSPSDTTPVIPVTAPAVPLKVLYPQAVIYAAETKSHSGTLGSDLNKALPMPRAPGHKVYPGFDYLLAAYAHSKSTPGEVLAGRLLGHKDLAYPGSIVFPDLIQTLMTADGLRAAEQGGAGTASASSDFRGASPDVASGGSLCSTLSDWVSHAYNSVFSALTVGSSSIPVLNFIGNLWNQAVDLAHSAISNIASLLTGPVISAIRISVATAGVIGWAVSTLRNLQVTHVEGHPSSNEFPADPNPGNVGSVTGTLGIPGGWNWPSGVQDCAKALLGHELPSLNSVAGRTVKWKLTQFFTVPTDTWCESGHACYLAQKVDDKTDTSLRSNHTATITYQTNTETANQHDHGDLITGDSILVEGTVGLDTSKLGSLIKDIVLGAVPGGVRVVAGPMVEALTSRLTGLLSKITQPVIFRYVRIDHHAKLVLPSNPCDALDMSQDYPPPPHNASVSFAPPLATLRGAEAGSPGAISSSSCVVTTYIPPSCPAGQTDSGPNNACEPCKNNQPCTTDGYHCSATVNCQPLGFYDLFVFRTDADAEHAFDKDRDALASGGVKWEDAAIGDQAVVNKDGASGLMRALNEVFYFGWTPDFGNDGSPEGPLQDALTQLCYGCTF